MQIKLVDAGARLRFSRHLVEMHHDRKRVFVDRLGWQLPTCGSWLEVDAFDNDYTVYLIACSPDDDRHVASVRLLPTTRPHMLGTIFSHLPDGGPIVADDVWESSRFTIAPTGMRGSEVMRLSQYLALAHVEFALLNGIGRYVMIGESHRVATVVAMGWRVRPLCLPTDCDGSKVVAMEVSIDEKTLPAMRRRFGIHAPVLEAVPGPTGRHAS
ncbi:acyl-homoserine-lactone synthase [Sphingosinicella terrae]|uniref:acyl-homoserine-lactone synthase n=1 Tax=Sphingosinicella terrae TaxID=2172047 RepID=UPI000E0D1A7E|nr:acyl-homoserine-lactone synthase [Sphingosinicella terrae]